MDVIVRGTTPTIKWVFSTVNVETISSAYLTIRNRRTVVIEKALSEATVDTTTKSVSWTLTQAETLALKDFQEYGLFCDWLLADGTRGAGKAKTVMACPAGKNEVIGNG